MFDKRASGVLLHISSLPSKGGIGTLGKYAYDFVDWLATCGQTYWQILPVCPTGYGDSPYQSFSTFAGNPYFIDLEMLEQEGLLCASDWKDSFWGDNITQVDYGAVYTGRQQVFDALQQHFQENIPADFAEFCAQNSCWLDDYALFMAIKDAHGGASFSTWEEDIRVRRPEALEQWRQKVAPRVMRHKMLQYLFFKQWTALKAYANEKGIRIIGDVPIYVAADSADVWSSPEQFALDEQSLPVEVAGCPPDAFSRTGQLWGNPVYNWERMKDSGYSWWKARLAHSLKVYDAVRIDHFRGFDSYYSIPYGEATAQRGVWKPGPGMDLFRALKEQLGQLPVIAEDLGVLTDSVRQLLADTGFPGMKVLQFAFGEEDSEYLLHNYDKNCVAYTGTHDNSTLLGWTMESASPAEVARARRYLRVRNGANSNHLLAHEMQIAVMSSVANTCILTMQDLLTLEEWARMNTPATSSGNWCWRLTVPEMSSQRATDFLLRWTKHYSRLNPAYEPPSDQFR